MMDYLITCSLISISLWWASQGLRNAPARLRFYLLIGALISWLIPWHLVPAATAALGTLDIAIDLGSLSWQQLAVASPPPSAGTAAIVTTEQAPPLLTLANAMIAMLSLGAVLFIRQLSHYRQILSQLHNSSRADSCSGNQPAVIDPRYSVKIVPLDAPAIATGFFKATIWLHPSLLKRSELESVLLHETTHIRQGDLRWLWLICLIESLFWWNPLCRLIATQARQAIELSCDEQCFKQLSQQYQADLASLLLTPLTGVVRTHGAATPILNIVNDASFNMVRVKMLNKEKVMKLKHIAVLVAAISVSAYAGTQISEGQNNKPVQLLTQATQFSDAYQAQQAALLQAAIKAKSTDPTVLAQVVSNIDVWQQNRQPLQSPEETVMKLNAFTLLAHVQHKLGQYQATLDTFNSWYPDGKGAPFFLRNITANSYLQLHKPQQAMQELEIVLGAVDERVKSGTLLMQALAYSETANYTEALKTLAHPNMNDDLEVDRLKYYIYSQQNDTTQLQQLARKLPADILNQPAQLPKLGLPGSPLLRLLPAA